MAEDPSLLETLPDNLQTAVDRKLTVGEAVLMSLSGAHGEALAVTDRRVMIVREQMPIVAGESQVDCFDYPYEQIGTVRVEDAVGGGHLRLVLTAPPVDDHEVTLFFPSYHLAKFDAAAARIRMLVEQTRALPVSLNNSAPLAGVPTALCPECSSPVDTGTWHYCGQCGAALGPLCAFCETLLPGGARFCPRCGCVADHPRSASCPACGGHVSALFAFCPRCGASQGARCGRCAGRILDGWAWCPSCGEAVEAAPPPAQDLPAAARQHNERGMERYNAERYEEAVQEFEAALAIDPENALYHCNLGVALAEMGRDEEALRAYETALRIAPRDPAVYLNLGYFHAERGNTEEARRRWEKVLEVAPESPEAAEARQNLEDVDSL